MYDRSPSSASTDAQELQELKICSSCAAPNDPRADFCLDCGAPIGTFTNYDPLKHIYAQGWSYRKAVTGRHIKPIVLVGMWLIFGPTVILIGLTVPHVLFDYWRPEARGVGNVLAFLTTGGIWLLYAAILWRVTKNYWKRRRFVPGTCPECQYNLTALAEYRCPECGTRIYPEEHVCELATPASNPESAEEEPAESAAYGTIPLGGFAYLMIVAAAILGSAFGPRLFAVKQSDLWAVLLVYLILALLPLEFHGIRQMTTSERRGSLLHVVGLLLNTLHGAMLVVALVEMS